MSADLRKQTLEIVDKLDKAYPEAHQELEFSTAFAGQARGRRRPAIARPASRRARRPGPDRRRSLRPGRQPSG